MGGGYTTGVPLSVCRRRVYHGCTSQCVRGVYHGCTSQCVYGVYTTGVPLRCVQWWVSRGVPLSVCNGGYTRVGTSGCTGWGIPGCVCLPCTSGWYTSVYASLPTLGWDTSVYASLTTRFTVGLAPEPPSALKPLRTLTFPSER